MGLCISVPKPAEKGGEKPSLVFTIGRKDYSVLEIQDQLLYDNDDIDDVNEVCCVV